MKRAFAWVACLFTLGIGCGSSTSGGPSDSGTHHDAGDAKGGSSGDAADAGGGGDTGQGACALVKTKGGPVEGAMSSTTCAYEGIPYAAPPKGSLRWKAPQPAASWTAPRPSAPQSGCPQLTSYFGMASTDEDCLYLNVWVPEPRPSGAVPVMVFVHGGGFVSGSGTFPLYDGTNLAAATGNIVVTLNYRLGPFGFLSNAELRGEDAHGSAGNYGILDQVAALEWVKANIAAFGGDTTKLALFGESAGGTSMFIHLTSPLSKGLFTRAMIESGWAPDNLAALPEATADGFGATFAKALGCTGTGATLLSCLRGKSASAVLNAVPNLASGMSSANAVAWLPVVDGYAIPTEPLQAFAAGSFTKVPTLLGNNKDEGTLFTFMSPPTDPTSYQTFADQISPGNGAAIVGEYPISAYGGSYFQAAAAALADGEFVCPTRRVARAIAKSGTPAFRYEFAHAIAFPIANLGAFHGSELLFVFGNPLKPFASLQASEEPLSKTMMGYWGAMAAGGDPNGGGRFMWPAYDLSTEPQIVLDTTISTVTQLRKAECDFWDGL